MRSKPSKAEAGSRNTNEHRVSDRGIAVATRSLAWAALVVSFVLGSSLPAQAQNKRGGGGGGGNRTVTPLTITCPKSFTAETDSSSGSWVTLPSATTSGGRNPIKVSSNRGSGTFPVGTTPVIVTATSKDRQTASCSYTVTVTLILRQPEPPPAPWPSPSACSPDQQPVPSSTPLLVVWQSTDATVTNFSVWVDGQAATWVPAGTFEASIPGLSSGVHEIVVQAWNGGGSGETLCLFDVLAMP